MEGYTMNDLTKRVFLLINNNFEVNNKIKNLSNVEKCLLLSEFLLKSNTINEGNGAETNIPVIDLMIVEEKDGIYIDYSKTKLNMGDFNDTYFSAMHYKNKPYLPFDMINKAFGNAGEYLMHNYFYLTRSKNETEDIDYLNDVSKLLEKVFREEEYDITVNPLYMIYNAQLLQIINGEKNIRINYDKVIPINGYYNYIKNIIPLNEANNYNLLYGTGNELYGSNTGLNTVDYLMRRICIARYQDALLGNSTKIAKCILHGDSTSNELLDRAIVRILAFLYEHYNIDPTDLHNINVETSELTTNIVENIDTFVTDFTNITTDYKLGLNESSFFLKKKRLLQIRKFLQNIQLTGNIRNKLFMLLSYSKLFHYKVIRKIFIILNNIEEDNNHFVYDKSQYSMFGKEPYTEKTIEDYCTKNGLHYTLIKKRYIAVKNIFPIKKYDVGADSFIQYLTTSIDKNIKASFLLYMYGDFKYDTAKKIVTNYRKNIYVDKNELYPEIDVFEPLLECTNKKECENNIFFLDRGIDWSRGSVLDYNKVYFESFKNGEPMLTGGSGHTADILISIGFLNNVDNEELLEIIKKFGLICIAAMFPRKDHSIYEIYRAINMFDILEGPNIWKCDDYDLNPAKYIRWLCNNGDKMECIREHTRADICLSQIYSDFVKHIINLVEFNKNDTVNNIATKILDDVRSFSHSLKISDAHIKKELFKTFYIIENEEKKKLLNDSEYAYCIQKSHETLKQFYQSGIPVPDSIANHEIYLFEDEYIRCRYKKQNYFYAGNSILNLYIALKCYFQENQCD